MSTRALRSPFVPGWLGRRAISCAPDSHRNREFLEQFSLDTLKMVGTLNLGGSTTGWCRPRTAACTG